MSGFGAIGAIPYIEIRSYIELVAKIEDPDDQELFIEVIEALDQEFLKAYLDKQEKERKKSEAKKSSTRRN